MIMLKLTYRYSRYRYMVDYTGGAGSSRECMVGSPKCAQDILSCC